ncbi:penicillin-binding protein 1C [Halocola ammonii]
MKTDLRKVTTQMFKWLLLSVFLIASVFFFFCLPSNLFDKPYSTTIEDREGKLLSAHIATDGQWRFPLSDSIPEKFEKCIIQFEDRNFRSHPGFYLPSIARALKQNISEGKVVSGGSTLTMQVVRLSRNNPERTIFEKLLEVFRAVRLESRFTKDEILNLYASHAPFGGNVVGLETAAWRYYNRSAYQLSWAETATLAVLPNAPSLIFPGKNDSELLRKRNRLLDELKSAGHIDSTTCALAKIEPLPSKPHPLPQLAHHLMTRCEKEQGSGQAFKSTLKKELQQKSKSILENHVRKLSSNGIHNVACIVADVKTGEVLSYVGNASSSEDHSPFVDIANSPRSSGSILKPFLYAAMLTDGEMLQKSLVFDTPVNFDGYAPKNYDEKFRGAVPADRALSMSLNIPSVRMLREHGIHKFHYRLKKIGLQTVDKSANHYGLSLILGGAEVTLWDLAQSYCGLASTLNHYTDYNGRYDSGDYQRLAFLKPEEKSDQKLSEQGIFSAASIYQTFEAMQELTRPENQVNWKSFGSSRKVAWKTGTSFGHRDAWAVGVTPDHVVAVWVGNADGEGRPGLSGVTVAAPVLFDLFGQLPASDWFSKPFDEMTQVEVCASSGYKVSESCPPGETLWIPTAGMKTTACPFHKTVHLDRQENYRVTSECYPVSEMNHQPWFLLPPVPEWYYARNHQDYKLLPPWLEGCEDQAGKEIMDMVYPKGGETVYLPITLQSERSKLVAKATHRQQNSTIYWHLDNEFLGETNEIHHMEIFATAGEHQLTLIDESGNSVQKVFTITSE